MLVTSTPETSSMPERSVTLGTAGTEASSLLTVAAVAARLGVNRSTVYRLLQRGELAHTRVSESPRVSTTALEAYITARTSTTWRPSRRGGGEGQAV